MTSPHRKIPILLAETANAHGGSRDYARRITESLAATRAPAVKFQYIRVDDFLVPSHPQYGLFKSFEFEQAFHAELVGRLHRKGKKAFFDVFGTSSLDGARAAGADGFKIYATDIGNNPLIRKVAAQGKPVLLSTGGATLEEIRELVRLCRGTPFCLMVGFQSFPTPVAESNLAKIKQLRDRFGCPVGYMDHSPADDPFSDVISCLAVAHGACCVEKHVFLKGRKTLYDWQSAFDPVRLDRLAGWLDQTRDAVGSASFAISSAEAAYGRSKRKVLVARRSLPMGTRLGQKDVVGLCVAPATPGRRFGLDEVGRVIGRVARRPISIHEMIVPEALRG